MPKCLYTRPQGSAVPDAIPLLICDDSGMARKQLMWALPRGWPFRITQADNGQAGLEAIRAGLSEIILFDLTMSDLDCYDGRFWIYVNHTLDLAIFIFG